MASSSAALPFHLLLCLFFSFFFVALVKARTHHDGALNDTRALIQFKKCITSDPLSLLHDWNDHDANACNWTGISCSTKHHGRVVEIALESAMLRGSLSPHLSNLSFLQVLDIGNNTFSGTIPSSLGTLHWLKILDLCGNEFEGGIPYQIGNLSSLQLLYLCSNSLVGDIPQSLATLQNLNKFNVYQNQLNGQIPSWLGALHKLEFLELAYNNIHGIIPAQLGNLSFLQHFSIGSNRLKGLIPCALASLYRLTKFIIPQNSLSGTIPACFRNLTALTILDFSVNNFHGHLPTWLGSFNKLQQLGLAFNRFTGNIPHSWHNLTQLQVLELSNNRLSGTPRSWLGRQWTQLMRFNIGYNNFISGVSMPTQPIPILLTLSNSSLLIHLLIYNNLLTGTVPPNFGSFLPNLQVLDLSGNYISGNIPRSVGNCSSLVRLNLYDNVFSGTIPAQITNVKSLQSIRLQRNKLQGHLPIEISLLNKSLGYLYLSNNMFTGSIPADIKKLVNLRGLHLDRNLLSGKIPSEIGDCPVLEDLVLSANNLSGPIPPKVADLKTIVFNFDLSGNSLTGEVPPGIAGLQMVQYINLSSNNLSGNIALYMDSWLDAREINLSFNHFSGNISKSIGNKLTQLESIDVSGNNFSGPVPASLFNYSSLYFLNFSCNNFDGEVPCLHSSSSKKLRSIRSTRWSFLGNLNLCGRCFGLKACLPSLTQKHKSHFNKSSILKIVLGILGGLLLLVVAVISFIFRRTKTPKGQTLWVSEKFLKISIQELQRATDNFSASNLVGEGSHGKVYRGVLSSGMVVAVKCFSSAEQHETVNNFKKECRALRKVKHRNILKIITVVWYDELKALVMPFLTNGNLHSLLHSIEDGQLTPLKLPMRVKILTELARGLAYLHHDCDFQVIHCDIKPENVLLDDDMTIKLSDFGISHLIGDFDDSTTSSSLAVKGSVGYIAPEYGIGQRVSVKGDVYSFGVVTLEVITRLKPTHEMFSEDVTLPLWLSRAFKGKSGDERGETVKDIIKIADQDGGGIEMDKDVVMSAVESILMVGLRCTSQNASMRPTMKEVELFLQSVYPLNLQNQRILPTNLEEVISIVESQPPLHFTRVEAETSTFSSD